MNEKNKIFKINLSKLLLLGIWRQLLAFQGQPHRIYSTVKNI